MQREQLAYLLIALSALVAVLPLAIHGCSCGHDFDFHLLNWMEAARQFTHGNLHPHWAYTAAYDAGEPRFVFYPPASWTLGAVLGLLLPWAWTPIVYTWLALTLSGFAMYLLTREFSSPGPALFASIFYAVNPYMLFTAYERTAYAELLAAAWIPLLLHAILRRRITVIRIAIPVALLWITNAPAAVMSCYGLALLASLRIVTSNPSSKQEASIPAKEPGAPCLDSETWVSSQAQTFQSRRQQSRNTFAGTALGLGLAAFYIVPAAWERRYVQIAMALLPGMRIEDNFLFHHTGDLAHDEVLHTASLIAVILLAAAILGLAVLLLTTKRREPHREQSQRDEAYRRLSDSRRLLLPLAILTLAILFLLTPATAAIWKHLPELAFLQFPWRLVAILAAVLSLTLALALPFFRSRPAFTIAVTLSLAACLAYPAYSAFQQTCDPEDTVSARLALFRSERGSEPTDEYTPATADNDSLAKANPPYWLSDDPDAKAPANSIPGPAPTHLILNSLVPQSLILNLRAYPCWRITRNGASLRGGDPSQRDDGLITLPIPAGLTMVDLVYTQTRDQTLGDAISLTSLTMLVLVFRLRAKSAA